MPAGGREAHGQEAGDVTTDTQRTATAVQTALAWVTGELLWMSEQTDDAPSQVALFLLSGIRKRLEGKKP